MEAFIAIISGNDLRSVMPQTNFFFEQCLHKTNFSGDNWQLASILGYNMHHIFNSLIPFLSLKIRQDIIVTLIPIAS